MSKTLQLVKKVGLSSLILWKCDAISFPSPAIFAQFVVTVDFHNGQVVSKVVSWAWKFYFLTDLHLWTRRDWLSEPLMSLGVGLEQSEYEMSVCLPSLTTSLCVPGV